MNLRGKYSVVSVGKALSQFIKKADLTLCSGSIKFNFVECFIIKYSLYSFIRKIYLI